MPGERLASENLVIRQAEEQVKFIRRMAERLNRAKFTWPVLEQYSPRNSEVVYRGLVVDHEENEVFVLTPIGKVLKLLEGGGMIDELDANDIFRASGNNLLYRIECTVNTALRNMHVTQEANVMSVAGLEESLV